jgi:molecular chaperone GrpE
LRPINEVERARLITEFERLLDLAGEEGESDEPLPEVDLSTLLTEMALLKNEVRLETRQSRATLGELKNLADLLARDRERLQRELEEVGERARKESAKELKSLLKGLLDVRDRLEAGLLSGKNLPPERGWRALFGSGREGGRVAGVLEGFTLTLSRLDDLLESFRVLPVEALDRPFDPSSMKGMGTVESERPDGWVVRELRKGYRREGELLRAAEVEVSRRIRPAGDDIRQGPDE